MTEIQYLWYGRPYSRELNREQWDKVHKLSHTRLGETPAGNDGDVQVAVCGEEFEGWSYGGSPLPEIGNLEQAKQTGLEFCDKCF